MFSNQYNLFIQCTDEKYSPIDFISSFSIGFILLSTIEIFYENGALDEFIRLFNHENCPDHQHVLGTILTLSTAKPTSLTERDLTLIQEFERNLKKRLETLDNAEEYEVCQLRQSMEVNNKY